MFFFAVLRASIQDVSPVNNRAALHLKLSPKTRALKLILKGGTVTTSMDFRQMRRRNRQRNRRHRVLKSRIYRHLEVPRQVVKRNFGYKNKNNRNGDDNDDDNDGNERGRPEEEQHIGRFVRSASPWSYNNYNEDDTPRARNQTFDWNTPISQQQESQELRHGQQEEQEQQRKQQEQPRGRFSRRRKARDSDLQDLDGITSLQLDCSACSSLVGRDSNSDTNEISRKRWLVMGRRVMDERTKQFSNQVQVRFPARSTSLFKHQHIVMESI